MAGILTGRQIINEKNNGRILIEPFNEAQVKPNSYDVSLGKHFWRMGNATAGDSELYFISDAESIDRTWHENVACTWEKAAASLINAGKMKDYEIETVYKSIGPDDLVIVVSPGELILAHTEEFIGSIGAASITTEMKARSSAGRHGISVCSCAGMGDPGYCTRWTMEIKNNSTKVIPLVVGVKLAQIVFIYTFGHVDPYVNSGSYQNTVGFNILRSTNTPNYGHTSDTSGGNQYTQDSIGQYTAKLKEVWQPTMMLPRPL